jgi:DMSO/TMAO reductase YedYZ molybdopterin-dependent catalytic subunit
MNLSRRDFVRTVPLAALGVGLLPRFVRGAAGDGMIVRMQEPRNLETPLSDLAAVTTEKFYVRSHFAVPAVDPKTFKLTVEGHVEKKLELTLSDIKNMEAVSRDVVLECAGNGRVFLSPAARGLQWGSGAVGQANWTGVPLGVLLDFAKVKPGAADVVLIGADKGAIADPATPGTINYDRGIPLAKARADGSLLAWKMNDEPLTPAHGAPLRAVVPGWYGMASVKWLSRIVVTDKPHAGFWQTFDYSVWERTGASPQLVPVTAIQPKAVITSVGPGDVLAAGKAHTIKGLAWAGEQAVKKVEISTDGGKTWSPATHAAGAPFVWTSWSAQIIPTEKGVLALVARCTDDKGNAQPDKRDPDRRTYMINHLVPTEVVVK